MNAKIQGRVVIAPGTKTSHYAGGVNPVKGRATSAGPARSSNSGKLTRKKMDDEPLSHIETQYITNLQQQIYYLELENAYLKNQLKKGHGYQPQLIAETDRYLDKLKKLQEQKGHAESQLKQSVQECQALLKERHNLHDRLQQLEDEYSRDKRSLSEDIVELRKQLDDTGPELSKRQSQFAQLNVALQDTNKRLRTAQRNVEMLEAQLNQKNKEQDVSTQLENERRSELDRLMANIKELECQLGEERTKTRTMSDEIATIRGQMRELELQARKDKAVAEKTAEENASIIKEVAQLAEKVAQAHAQLEHYESEARHDHLYSESAHLREAERQLRHRLSKMEELYKLEETRTAKLTSQLSEQELSQQAVKEAQSQLQSQLESLEELSRNMSYENKQLRSEKIILESRMEEIKNALASKEIQLDTLQNRVQYLEQHQKELVRQFEEEMQIQEAKFRELERTAIQCRDISRSIRHSSVLGKAMIPETPMSNGMQ